MDDDEYQSREEEHRAFHYSTDAEWDKAEAGEIGRAHPERAWILSDRDCWYPNPSYRGPKVPHPESTEY